MEIKKLLKKFKIDSTDIPIILVCFGLTILISLVYYNYGSIKTSYNVVVDILDDGNMVATEKDGQPLRDFTAKIVTKSTEKIEDSNIKAYVDLRSKYENGEYIPVTEEGVYDFPVVVEIAAGATSAEINKVEYSPKTVKLRVEPKTEEWVKIIPTLSGELGVPGYEVSRKVVTPEVVKISGGKSVVEKAKKDAITTNAIDLSKVTNKFSTNLIEVKPNLKNLDSRLKVAIDEEKFLLVAIDLTPIQGQQKYDGINVTFTNLKENFSITNSDMAISIILKGSELNLENIDPSRIFVFADCVSVTGAGTYEIPISITVPSGTSIIDQPQSVKIWVEEIKEESLPENSVPQEEPDVLEKIEDAPENELEEVKDLELM